MVKSIRCARAWPIASMFSLRDSVQRTGLPVWRASQATITSSVDSVFAPNPPPTSGPITRTCAGSIPNASAIPSRSPCGVCVESRAWSRPSSNQAAVDRGSIGAGAMRWLTTRPRTTTSQPSKMLSSPATGT